MKDLSLFDPNGATNFKNNVFGLPFSEEEADLVILPVAWEVTVSDGGGTSRAPEHVFRASRHVDLFDPETDNAWRKGIFMRSWDEKIEMKGDFLRKEAELYLDYISTGGDVENNNFLSKSLREINEGGALLNDWVYRQTRDLLIMGKKVALLGGDHSTPLGFLRALAEQFGDFGVLQIDAHCDLRKSYEGFIYSHGSIMYNALSEISQIKKLVQLGVRDYCEEEWNFICNSNFRVATFFDKEIKERQWEGQTWKAVAEHIIEQLPGQVYLSFDVDGLDPKLCPSTGTPVPGGMEADQIFYLLSRILQSGRKFIGFDLCEIGVGPNGYDATVGARILWKLCNYLLADQAGPQKT